MGLTMKTNKLITILGLISILNSNVVITRASVIASPAVAIAAENARIRREYQEKEELVNKLENLNNNEREEIFKKLENKLRNKRQKALKLINPYEVYTINLPQYLKIKLLYEEVRGW